MAGIGARDHAHRSALSSADARPTDQCRWICGKRRGAGAQSVRNRGVGICV